MISCVEELNLVRKARDLTFIHFSGTKNLDCIWLGSRSQIIEKDFEKRMAKNIWGSDVGGLS